MHFSIMLPYKEADMYNHVKKTPERVFSVQQADLIDFELCVMSVWGGLFY